MNFDQTNTATCERENAISLVTKTPILNVGDIESKRLEILAYFHNSYSLYESLFECLAGEEAFYARANPLRHPLIFYYGHTAVFYINKLNVANLIDHRIDPRIESTLAIGVDEMSWDDLNDKNYDWPTPQEVKSYRDQAREVVDRFIRECDFTMPIDWNSPLWIVLMGIEHERIHLETSSVLIRELPLDLLRPHDLWGRIGRESTTPPVNQLLPVAGGQVRLGKSKDNPLYGWDNEYGESIQDVDSFQASKFLVSNQEFLEFVDAGGYSDPQYWTEEGRGWLAYRKACHPVYWIKDRDTYKLRTMLEVIEMPWSWPVEVNYLEAKAFCNWKSQVTGKQLRLPTEAEWYKFRDPLETDQPYWDVAPGNINLEHQMSPCPVDRHEFHDGFFDVIGNVWQWTETPIDGFAGFEVHPAYDDFAAPTFDGKHNLFKGGCWISTGNYAIKDSRYAFRRHFFQHSGFRYIEAAPLPETVPDIFESDAELAREIEFHFGKEDATTGSFHVACVNEVAKHLAELETGRALDLGCSSGRAAFELAKHFAQVEAVDFSVRSIEAPVKLQSTGKQRYLFPESGELFSYREVRLADFPGYTEVKDRIAFLQGDACNLPEKYTGYDLVFAGNLLDSLYDPGRFLELIKDRIVAGGLLVLASPYLWSTDKTPREKWLGGYKGADTGENVSTRDSIARILAPEFTMLNPPVDIPYFIRESKRSARYGVSELTVWKKNASS